MRHYNLSIVACLVLAVWALTSGCKPSSKKDISTSSGEGKAETMREDSTTKDTKQGPTSDPLHPMVVIETSLGNITVVLDAEKAPLTVDNFLFYVNAGHYEQTIVHQVYKGQGMVAGGYDTNYTLKPARTPIRNEAHNGLKNRRGTIAMVRLPDEIDSATSQFFINVADNTALDHRDRTPEGYGYCVFGEVVEGMDVVDRICNTPVHDTATMDQTPVEPIVIKSIRRIR